MINGRDDVEVSVILRQRDQPLTHSAAGSVDGNVGF
jgi:hypothetical protein